MATPTALMREDFQPHHHHQHHGTEVSPPPPPPQPPKEGNGAVPSGFILKLYQMVNGAPDDVICWTQGGDAFKIGADLNKLEAETLPQYFRHSRFQSLVRQLNFYNFRKVNRERTFWIYKHQLFHRDRPQDLHLLRRRTCPGVDGRKNRFSATGAPRKSNNNSANSSANNSSTNLAAMAGIPANESRKSTAVLDCLESNEMFRTHANSREHSDDDSSAADPSDEESSAVAARKPRRKRSNTSSYEKPPRFQENNKRSRRGWNLNYTAMHNVRKEESEPEDDVHVDLSLVTSAAGVSNSTVKGEVDHVPSSRLFRTAKDDDEDDASTSDKDERSEMLEQSLVVSQVAMKLEEYVRKAKKGSGRARRSGPQGVVTPPHPNAMAYSAPRGVLTYDDEYNFDSDDDDECIQRRDRSSSSSTGVVTDGDDSMTSEDDPRPAGGKRVAFISEVNTPVQPIPKKLFLSAPVDDVSTVNVVVKTLLERANTDVPATIAQFCMTTAPNGCDDLCSKVLQLISSCDMLGIEFQQYRGALHPLECSSTLLPSCMFTTGFRKNHAVSVQQIWERSASRNDAVRDFKTFAVNCLNEVLDNAEVDKTFLSTCQTSALKHTADIWLKSTTASF